MSRYSLSQKLPSCAVNQRLLLDLEEYITDRMGQSRYSQHFSIKDSFGTEKLAMVADFKSHVFPDDTKLVELAMTRMTMLSADGVRSDSLDIRLHFDVSGISSSIEVECDGPDARELAQGIGVGIQTRIRPYRTYNDSFSLYSSFRNLVILPPLLLVPVVVLIITFRHMTVAESVLASLSWSIFVNLAFWGLSRLRPYTTFDTVLNKRKDKWFVLVMYGIVLALVIGVVGSLLATYLWQQSHPPGK